MYRDAGIAVGRYSSLLSTDADASSARLHGPNPVVHWSSFDGGRDEASGTGAHGYHQIRLPFGDQRKSAPGLQRSLNIFARPGICHRMIEGVAGIRAHDDLDGLCVEDVVG